MISTTTKAYLSRTEYGSVEGQVIGCTQFNSSPAFVFQERLSGDRIICALAPDFAERLGPEHRWPEVWSGQYLRIGGELIYGADGTLKWINASYHEKIRWADVSLSDIRGLDVLKQRTVHQHLDEFWGE